MLSSATAFPQVGSYALYEDPELPRGDRRPELVRILELGATVALVAFPLREGRASGNKRLPLADLLDGTPLTAQEKREEVELFRQVTGKDRLTPRQKQLKVRHDALRARMIWSGCLQRKLDDFHVLQRRQANATSQGVSGGQGFGVAA